MPGTRRWRASKAQEPEPHTPEEKELMGDGPSFAHQPGALAAGNDILVEELTLQEAQVKCAALAQCVGYLHPPPARCGVVAAVSAAAATVTVPPGDAAEPPVRPTRP